MDTDKVRRKPSGTDSEGAGREPCPGGQLTCAASGPARGTVEAMLRDRITRALHLGQLRPGARLPSARSTAGELGVDRRCVVAALRALSQDGLVELRSRSGVFVARQPSPRATASTRADARANSALLDCLTRGVAAGVSVGDLVSALAARLDVGLLRTACVSDNGDQGAALCAEARHIFGLVTTWADAHEIADDRPLPRDVRAAEYVLATAHNAGAAQQLASRLGVSVTLVTPRADRLAPLLEALAREPVYFIGTDLRFAEAVLRQFADAPRGRVRPVVLGSDSAGRVPYGAAVYLMPTAEARLGGAPPHWRVLPRACAFSTESAGQVIATMLRAGREPPRHATPSEADAWLGCAPQRDAGREPPASRTPQRGTAEHVVVQVDLERR